MTVVVVLLVIILLLLAGGAILGLAFELLWLALTGLIIGALGRLVLPGRQEIGLLQTALIGIAASLLGGVLGEIFDAGWLIRFLVANVVFSAIGDGAATRAGTVVAFAWIAFIGARLLMLPAGEERGVAAQGDSVPA